MTRYVLGLIAALLAGCSVEPAPLITIAQGHPGNADSGAVAYVPPANPFKGDVPAAVPPGGGKEAHEGHEQGDGKKPAAGKEQADGKAQDGNKEHAGGHEQSPQGQAGPKKDYPLDVCIVSGEKLGSMGKPAVLTHEGREVRFCCPACIPKFKEDPAKYLKKLDDAEKNPKPAEKKDADKAAPPKKHDHEGKP